MKGALDAAYQVLSEAGEALHYQEIVRRALEKGYWQTTGKTPAATVNAQLSVDIRKRGEASRFRRVRRGVFAVNDDVTPPAKTQKTSPKTLSFTDAAERVLRGLAGRRPMHYRDMTRKALELALVSTSGLTPEATMYAQIIQENQRRSRRGERPRFERYGKGMVGLTLWHGEGLAYQIEQHNRDVRKKLHQRLLKMPPEEFEDLIGRLLGEIGFEEVGVTSRAGDGGIDVRGTLVVGEVIRTRMALQVKRWKNNVQAPTVQQVRGSLGTHEQGLIISTSDFSKGARAEAERPDAVPVALMNGDQLVSLLVENGIGVQRKPQELIELGESGEDQV